uniref:Reverse transcriptase domain-containing protein n=1 Tax=Tanacetum cinerariifolium TaxID=118510 RepID=A0A6L2N0Y1_TANCI|nr:reverse transcriptase domain-containing protein [Tanacetum cinerariifolium]
MSAMANTTPLVTTVTKPATNPRDADATPRVNIQEFCEEYYEDILPIIMDKVCHDRRKDIHTRLDFGEGPRERTREDSHHSSARARTTKPEHETYSLSTTKSRPWGTGSRDHPRGRSYPYSLDTSKEDPPKDRERLRDVGESHDDSFSHSFRDGNRSRHMKRRRDNESPLSSVSKSDSSDGSYKDLKAAFLAYFMQQKKYVKDPVEIHNIKQKDGETIEDFIKRFKVETRRMKGAPWCMQISEFMHGVINPELIKCLNEHVPKTMKEMMITTTAFIRGEAVAASKKKGHLREGKGSNRFTPLTRTPKEIRAAKAGKFQPPPPMVIPVEKRSSNKFCDFYNDKGHSTDECMQLKKQIEELVRASKLSHLIKEIKQGRDQSKTGKKETTAKDKPTAIYMIQSWQRTTRQKVTQSFERVKEIMFPPLLASSGIEGLLVIKAEMGGHMIHRITVLIPTECTSVITSSVVSKEERTRPANFKVALHPDFPEQEVAIGGTLSDKGRTELCSILKKNLYIFAWQPSDMTEVPRSVAKHRLNIREGYSPVRQKKRGQAPERAKAIQAEVQKLVEAGIMREVYYHDWLSNPFMDCYPLSVIDWKVKSLCGYPFKCFLDAYKGYHQIQLAEPDEEKTAFHTRQGVYCYTKMPFGLKNDGATYQRLMDKAFESQIDRNIEVYVDDLVVKCYTEAEMMRDIEETFRTLRKVNMKLNPKKRAFGLAEGVFLGYVVTPEGIKPSAETQQEPWTLFMDGSSCVDGSGAGIILTNPEGIEFTYTLRFQFAASNNKAEYEALIAGLRIAARMGVKNVHVSVDSKLVANQVLGTYVAKEDNMVKYLEIVKSLVSGFTTFSISQVPRSKNKKADAQSKDKSIKEKEVETVIEEDGPTWMTPIVDYLKEGTLPGDKKEARKLRLKARQYELMEGILYRRSFFTPWLRCIRPLQAESVIREIHEGSCSMHAGPHLQQPLTQITALWPFYKWGIDIAGPSQEGPGKVKFFIVAMDYFTKWIEAKAVATITGEQVKKFVWDNIVCRFGIPGEIVSDNGKQFSDNPFNDWCDKLNIIQRFTSVKDLQSNGLVERANRIIPTEIRMPTYRIASVDVVSNDEELRLNLDLLEERSSDFVYRSNDASHAVAGRKLGPKWEGPYEVTKALGDGAYKLRSMDGIILPST